MTKPMVKLCDPCLSALRTRYLSSRVLYKSAYFYLDLYDCRFFTVMVVVVVITKMSHDCHRSVVKTYDG